MVLLNSSSQKFICLLYADLVASVFSFLVSIKHPGTIYNCFLQVSVHKGAFFSNIFSEVFVNRVKLSDCMLSEDNSLINLSLNSLLSRRL